MQHLLRPTAEAAHGDARRMLVAIPDVDKAGEVGCDLGAVHPGFRGEALGLAAVEGDPEEVALQRTGLPAQEIELAGLIVQRDRRLGRPLATG